MNIITLLIIFLFTIILLLLNSLTWRKKTCFYVFVHCFITAIKLSDVNWSRLDIRIGLLNFFLFKYEPDVIVNSPLTPGSEPRCPLNAKSSGREDILLRGLWRNWCTPRMPAPLFTRIPLIPPRPNPTMLLAILRRFFTACKAKRLNIINLLAVRMLRSF